MSLTNRDDLPLRLRQAMDQIGAMGEAGEIDALTSRSAQDYLAILVMAMVNDGRRVTPEQIDATRRFALERIHESVAKQNISALEHRERLQQIFGDLELAKNPRIRIAPGFSFCRFLGYFCTKTTRERVLEAYHAEVVADWVEHVAQGQWFGALVIVTLMYPRMIMLVFGSFALRLLSSVVGKMKAD
jgi:hypothetical protein